MMKKFISIVLTFALMLSFSACSKNIKSENLSEKIKSEPPSADAVSGDYIANFGARLFSECFEGENTLISPLSVMCALAMVQNGARGETKKQMEEVLGADCTTLNTYLSYYCRSLPAGEKYKASLANSIWLKNDGSLTVNGDFLHKNADYFSADIFKSDFDSQTVRDINNWVSESTDEMIPKVLDNIPDNTVMYLINALAFEAEWENTYDRSQVSEGIFTTVDSKEVKTDFMYSEESEYLENENTTGFVKYYKDRKYAFAALLPREGTEITDYIENLSGKEISTLLETSVECVVETSIPKFESEYTKKLPDILKNMGMTDAFSTELADLSSLGTYENENLFIGDVIHKTFISVAEKGTKAGAATVISTVCTSAAIIDNEPKRVYLDRPFVYILIDCETNTPIFIGAMTNP